MVDDGTAKRVEVNGRVGYLVAYDWELGFSFIPAVEYVNNECEYELSEDEIKIL